MNIVIILFVMQFIITISLKNLKVIFIPILSFFYSFNHNYNLEKFYYQS